MTNGEAGIENEKEKVFLLEWMETYKKNQEKRGKKDEAINLINPIQAGIYFSLVWYLYI